MHEVKIERINKADTLDRCAEILVEAYNSEPWNDQWTKEVALDKLTIYFNTPKFIGWTASYNGQIIGCCVGNIEPYFTGDYYYLKDMFVLPTSQKLGIGSTFISTIKKYLNSINVKMIILFTSQQHFPFAFYQKTGFAEMDGMRMMILNNNEQ
ncbi:MAG: GNAT family N-acetyltransferase [Bacteroidota bacterium]